MVNDTRLFQHEIREGNTVTGQYSLIESDGSRRIVDYTAGNNYLKIINNILL